MNQYDKLVKTLTDSHNGHYEGIDVTKYLQKDDFVTVYPIPVKSTLEQKFRRRWVGGKWVDERIK